MLRLMLKMHEPYKIQKRFPLGFLVANFLYLKAYRIKKGPILRLKISKLFFLKRFFNDFVIDTGKNQNEKRYFWYSAVCG